MTEEELLHIKVIKVFSSCINKDQLKSALVFSSLVAQKMSCDVWRKVNKQREYHNLYKHILKTKFNN